MLKSISAEFLKLSYAPIIWLCSVVVLIVSAIVFASNYLDVNSVVKMGIDLWPRQFNAGHAIFTIFMLVPFTVMLLSTALFVEHNAKGWKQLYASPHRRTLIFYSKLFTLLILIALIMVGMHFSIIAVSYVLDYFLPELEFRYYQPEVLKYLLNYVHSFIALLGVIGIQYFLSLRFKGFLIPMSFGVVAFIVGFIIATLNKPMALYSPYSYVSIVKDFKMFTIDRIGVTHDHWLSNVEVYSIVVFLVFISLANLLEIRKNVTA